VAAELAQASLREAPTITTAWLPKIEREDLGDSMRLTVVPRPLSVAPSTRGSLAWRVAIEVGINLGIAADETDDDAIRRVQFTRDEVARFLIMRPLATMPDARTVGEIEFGPSLSDEHLNELRVVTSVLRITYEQLTPI
jgi:hypothetical protein